MPSDWRLHHPNRRNKNAEIYDTQSCYGAGDGPRHGGLNGFCLCPFARSYLMPALLEDFHPNSGAELACCEVVGSNSAARLRRTDGLHIFDPPSPMVRLHRNRLYDPLVSGEARIGDKLQLGWDQPKSLFLTADG